MNFSTIWWRWIFVVVILIAFLPTVVENALNFQLILNSCENCTFNRDEKCERFYAHRDPCEQNMAFISNERIAAAESSLLQCCTVKVDCKNSRTSKYRTIDGSCNNLQNPSWGMSNICLRRILPHDYGDGKSYPRQSCIKRHQLPNARKISNLIHRDVEVVPGLDFHTVLFSIWGQFIAHDCSFNDIQPVEDFGEKVCCIPKPMINDCCISVDVPENDPFFQERGKSCLPIVRTKPYPSCESGKREGLNEATSYIDLSLVYGSDQNTSNILRSWKDGMLKVQEIPGVGSLPPGINKIDACFSTNSEYKCFLTGDKRANLHLILATLHIVFLRNHNNLCRRLKNVNSHWDDEKLYQEARRISIAQCQLITFGHYLKEVMGPMVDEWELGVKGVKRGFYLAPEVDIKHFPDQVAKQVPEVGAKPEPKLGDKPESPFTTYDSSLDASTIDEFTAAALRYGHTMVSNIYFDVPVFGDLSDLPDGSLPGVEPLISPDPKNDFKINEKHIKYLRDYYNYPDEFYQKPFADRLAQGSGLLFGWKHDPLLGTDIRNYLFAMHGDVRKGGRDLAAISIVRGRDHGIPGYTYYLKHFFNYDVKTFCDLRKFIPKDFLKLLREMYRSVHDIDLYTAGLCENHIKGALVGPTFAVILFMQYRKLKFGDRYYFEHGNQEGSFTPEQLFEIKKTLLSKIICDTTGVKMMQENIFYLPQPGNPWLPCSAMPKLDLQHWREKS